MMREQKPPVTVYLSYAQKDEALKQEFEDYLSIMQQTQVIASWAECQVKPGTDWSQIIDPHILTADLILLLVSPSFLASGYCSGAEFHEAFERSKTRRETVLIPILLHHINLAGHPLGAIAWLPRGKPVSSWSDRHKAWLNVDQEIRQVITHIRQTF
ncbi:hypothetical protein KDW_39730 [Dictyobacter vulcani]|uniref:TIR domain-containing protein n=1 Tax=Dictyobacter vulcani TaxID=2607529 RepID=A0A5J4KTL8_9CHLR|nr:toll/interleukin-1 receptor domain-containing protein [Dictyobacter vulcani]GER89811.1 hypothetical protein KDW_39730 [Dictyobacter vulcani]